MIIVMWLKIIILEVILLVLFIYNFGTKCKNYNSSNGKVYLILFITLKIKSYVISGDKHQFDY